MRSAVVIACALMLSGCFGTAGRTIDLAPSPVKFSVEQFRCAVDPGAWRRDANDNEVGANRRAAAEANKSCLRMARTACFSLAANGQIEGRCEDLPEPK